MASWLHVISWYFNLGWLLLRVTEWNRECSWRDFDWYLLSRSFFSHWFDCTEGYHCINALNHIFAARNSEYFLGFLRSQRINWCDSWFLFALYFGTGFNYFVIFLVVITLSGTYQSCPLPISLLWVQTVPSSLSELSIQSIFVLYLPIFPCLLNVLPFLKD